MLQLSSKELDERKGSEYYFKNGKPKKKYMLCMDPEYVRSVTRFNGYGDARGICGGSECPFYDSGCDNAGLDWK